MDEHVIGSVRLALSGESDFEGKTAAGVECSGNARRWSVSANHGFEAELLDVSWENGERDVRAATVAGSPSAAHLMKGLRLAVQTAPNGTGLFVPLRQARVKLNTLDLRASLYDATKSQLDVGSGIEVEATLRSFGASAVGKRQDLLGEPSHAPDRLIAVFDEESVDVPIIAYLSTRLLPLRNMWWKADSEDWEDYAPPAAPSGKDRPPRRVYVILLGRDLDQAQAGRWVYVGETGRLIEERFRQHKVNYKASSEARRFGWRLMPELYDRLPTYASPEASRKAESDLADELRALEYKVAGGH